MTDHPAPQTVPASPLCRVNNCYWLLHQIGLDGTCARCGASFGGLAKVKEDER